MGSVQGIREINWFDCPGGGQIRVEGTTAYLGHMNAPYGTSIIDVADPANPKLLSRLEIPKGTHSHKVREHDGIMVVNREMTTGPLPDGFPMGLGIYDVSDPANPKHITTWATEGKGVHRFDFDGRYAYVSATMEGFVSNIMVILDLKDPAKPEVAGKWWIPGQWEAGGEEYIWGDGPAPRCHHPLRMGDRLYTSYWHHGFFILDVEDIANPKMVSGLDVGATFPHPRHTALPIPFPVHGHNIMILADEDVAKLHPHAPAFTWIVDITDETNPVPISSWQVEGLDPDGAPQPPMSGCHQPCEIVTGTDIPFAWFAQGLRILDVANPFAPKEVAHFMPDPPSGAERLSSNDVTVDDRGLIYLVDRIQGLHILERE